MRVRIIVFLDKPAKPKFVTAPATPPDADKLARGILDALTIAGIYDDDALVVSLEIDKMWASERVDKMSGAEITIVTIW